MTCHNCRRVIEDNSQFCTGCGAPQAQQQNAPAQPPQQYQQPQQPAHGAPQEWYRNAQVHQPQPQPQNVAVQPQYGFTGGKSGYFTMGERNIETDRAYTAEEIMERLCQHARLPGPPYYHKYGKEYFVYIPGTGTKDMCVNHSWFPGKFVLEEVDRPGTFGKSVLMAGLTSGWADVAEAATSNLNQLMDQVANELWRLFGSHLKGNG